MSEPAQRRVSDDGGRYYEHPTRVGLDGTPVRYTSVTTALSVISKPALLFWATKLSAQRALDNLPRLIAAARREPCGLTRKRVLPPGVTRCGECAECVRYWVEMVHVGEKERRAREGSAIHDVIEWWSKTGVIRFEPSEHLYEYEGVTRQVTREQIQPYIDAFLAWVADYGIEPEDFQACEATVWHHDDLWAGTLDGILRVRPRTAKAAKLVARIHAAQGRTGAACLEPVLVVLDNKSREGDDKAFYQEFALQVGGAYRHAQTITPKHSLVEAEMFRTDGAVILQVRPDGYSFEPVSSTKREYGAFLDAMRLYRWSADHGNAAVQVGTFPTPEGWTKPTWERASPPTGGLCGCAYCDDPNDGRCQFGGVRPIGAHTREVDADGQPVTAPKKRAAPRKKAVKTAEPATGPQPGMVTVVDRADGAAVFYPPAELLAEQAEAPKPPVKRAPAKRVGFGATLDSMRDRQRIAGAELSDEEIPF